MREIREPQPITSDQRASRIRKTTLTAARLAPWLVFGPITGLMSEAAIQCFRTGRRRTGALYIALNIAILLALPLATALLAARL